MTEPFVLLVLLRDAPGALERLLGLLRRRALEVDGLSVYLRERGTVEAAIRFGPLTTPADRLEAEVASLVDVVVLRRPPTRSLGTTREIALAATHGAVGPWPPSEHGALRIAEDGTAELTGSPSEIDRALDLLSQRGVLAASSRSGELFPPLFSDSEEPQGETHGPA